MKKSRIWIEVVKVEKGEKSDKPCSECGEYHRDNVTIRIHVGDDPVYTTTNIEEIKGFVEEFVGYKMTQKEYVAYMKKIIEKAIAEKEHAQA